MANINMKLLVLLFLFSITGAYGQNKKQQFDSTIYTHKDYLPSHKNAIVFECLGSCYFYSLNYERTIFGNDTTSLKSIVNIGLAYYPEITDVKALWIPIAFNELFKLKRTHYLSVSIGGSITDNSFSHDEEWNYWSFLGNLMIGYRYQIPKKRFFFQLEYIRPLS